MTWRGGAPAPDARPAAKPATRSLPLDRASHPEQASGQVRTPAAEFTCFRISRLSGGWSSACHCLRDWSIGSSSIPPATPRAFRPHAMSTLCDYTSWTSLTDRNYLGRLVPAFTRDGTDLPTIEDTTALFAPQGPQQQCPKSTLLFPIFAQYLTDGFLRTNMQRSGQDHIQPRNRPVAALRPDVRADARAQGCTGTEPWSEGSPEVSVDQWRRVSARTLSVRYE